MNLDSDSFRFGGRDTVLRLLLALTLACAFTSGLSVEVGGLTVTLAYGATALLVCYELLYAAFSSRRVAILYRDEISLLLYLLVGLNFLSSLFFSPDRWYSLKGCVPLLACLLIYTAIRTGLRLLQQSPRGAVDLMSKLNLFSAALGLGCMLVAFITGLDNFGVSYGHLAIGMQTLAGKIPPSIRSLSIEPNLFSIATASVFSLTMGRFLMDELRVRKWLWLGVPLLAILFAYTRSVYGALAIVIFLFLLMARKFRVAIRVVTTGLIAGLIVVGVFFALPQGHPAKQALVERASTLTDFSEGTGGGRLIVYQLAWKSYLKHPILGNGTLSADTKVFNSSTGEYQERMGAPGWLTGSGIQALHDTGLVGLLILLALFGVILMKNYTLFEKLNDHRGLLLGFFGGNLILFISSQLSSPLWTAFPYVFWAMNAEFLVFCGAQTEGKIASAP